MFRETREVALVVALRAILAMSTTTLETWVKSMTTWQLKHFGSLSVRQDVGMVDRELLQAHAHAREEVAIPSSTLSESVPESPGRRSRVHDSSDEDSPADGDFYESLSDLEKCRIQSLARPE